MSSIFWASSKTSRTVKAYQTRTDKTMWDWMNVLMEWLNNKSGAITGISTIVLALLTGIYVILTWNLLKASHKPEIMIYIDRSNYFNDVIIALFVENVGNGVARKVVFGGDFSFLIEDRLRMYSNEQHLGDTYFIKNGIDAFAPGQSKQLPLASLQKDVQINIWVTYKDSDQHNEYKKEFSLDLRDKSL